MPEPKPDHDQDRDHDQDALVATARQGDRAALGTLAMRHRPVLVAVCRGALGDADLAEDAAQEAVLLALTSLDQSDRAEPLSGESDQRLRAGT